MDRGSASMDINPDDIESISVLKGPNAEGIYTKTVNDYELIFNEK